jgi:DNA-binding transcriptional LysR family regulator
MEMPARLKSVPFAEPGGGRPLNLRFTEVATFVAVAHFGSVNRAAAHLRLTQPAVTRQLQRVEEELGIDLFDRRTKPSRLTAAGHAALERCRDLLAAFEELRGLDNRIDTKPQRVGIAHAVAPVVFGSSAEPFPEILSNVPVAVTINGSRALVTGVESGDLDAAVVLWPIGASPSVVAHCSAVTEEKIIVLAPMTAPLPALPTLADLASFPWVIDPECCGIRKPLEKALARAGLPFRVAVEMYGSEYQLSLISRGVGIGLGPVRVVQQSRYVDSLKLPRVKDFEPSAAIWVVQSAAAIRSRYGGMLLAYAERQFSAARAKAEIRYLESRSR